MHGRHRPRRKRPVFDFKKFDSEKRQARQQAAMRGPLKRFWKKSGRKFDLQPHVLRRLHDGLQGLISSRCDPPGTFLLVRTLQCSAGFFRLSPDGGFAAPVTTDEELMLECGGGREAFEQLFERYRGGYGGSSAAAGPILLAPRNSRRTCSSRSCRGAPLPASRSVSLLSVRHRLQHPARGSAEGLASARRKGRLDADPPAAVPAIQKQRCSVRSALARLDAGDRDILMLREYEQLSYSEIANFGWRCRSTPFARGSFARVRALKAVLDLPGASPGEGDSMTVV